MSRYTADEITNLSKATLISYVNRQPEIVFPVKICSRPVEKMDKKHLIRALTGNYGYIKPLVAPSLAVPEALSYPSDSADSEDPIDLVRSGSLPLQQQVEDDREDELCSALIGAVYLGEPTPPSNSSLEGVKANDRFGGSQPGSMHWQRDRLEHDADQIEPELVGEQDLTATHSDLSSSSLFSLAALEPVALSAPYSSWAPDSTATESHHASSTSWSTAAPESVDQAALAVSTLPSLSSSPTHTGHLIDWYDIDDKSDEDLLDAYFRQNPGLVEQLSHMKTHRRKRQTDAGLVRDYKFSLEVYKLLMERRWENESGRILSESILKYIGLSAPWLTKARKVTQLLDKIGPESPNPDPYVLQRFSSGATIRKGEDILTFLKARANTAGIQ